MTCPVKRVDGVSSKKSLCFVLTGKKKGLPLELVLNKKSSLCTNKKTIDVGVTRKDNKIINDLV